MSWFKNPWDPEDGAYGEENASNHGYLASRLKKFFQQGPSSIEPITVYFGSQSLNLIQQQSALLAALGQQINQMRRNVSVWVKGGDDNIGLTDGSGANNAMTRATNVSNALSLRFVTSRIAPTQADINASLQLPVPRKEDFEFLGHNTEIATISILSVNGSNIPPQTRAAIGRLKRQIEAIRP